MSIERFCDCYTPTCDLCGDELGEEYTFEDAVESKKRNGWRSYNQDGTWLDVCPECQQTYKDMFTKRRTAVQDFIDLFDDDKIQPVKLGNDNKTGECGMCGIKVDKLYPRRVGQIDFMICSRCKAIMDM